MRAKDFDEQEVLRKAIHIFWEKGYNATSLHDLIDGLGIGRSSIYHAFGDKHQLFVRALELYQCEGTARIIALLKDAPTVKKAIENLLSMVVNDVLQNSCPKGCFKVNTEVEVSANDDTVNKMVHADDMLIEEALREVLTKAQENGEISPSKDPLALARFFSNTVTGMRVYAKFRTEHQFFEDISKTAISVLD